MSKSTKFIAALGVVAGLGVAALPLSSYATASISGQVDLEVTVDNAIAMTIQGEGEDDYTYAGSDPAAFGGEEFTLDYSKTGPSSSKATLSQHDKNETMKSTITVYTNVVTGYNLGVKDADANTALVSEENTIPAGDTIVAGTAAWGYKVNNAGDYAAVTAENVNIDSFDQATMNGHETVVSYGVSTAEDQASGTYKDSIIYTATTK